MDKALADLNGNTAAFRLSEDRAFIEAMNQEWASTIFYGNTSTDPEKFMGLAPRYNDEDAENAANIIDGAGTSTDCTSIWLVTWGESTCHGIFPKGSSAGISHEDLGQVTLSDGQTPAGRYEGYRSHYKIDTGLCLRDWRYVVRIDNIQLNLLDNDLTTGANLVDLMIQAVETLPSLGMGKPVFYANKTVTSMLRRQVAMKSNLHLGLDEFAGKKILAMDGIPIKKCDAILSTEDHVTSTPPTT